MSAPPTVLRELELCRELHRLAGGPRGTCPALAAVRMNGATEVTRLRGDLEAELALRGALESKMLASFGRAGSLGDLGASTYVAVFSGGEPAMEDVEHELAGIHDYFSRHPIQVGCTYYYPRTKSVLVPPGCPLTDALSVLRFGLDRVAGYEEPASVARIGAGHPGYREHKRLRRALRHVRDALYRQRIGLHVQPIVALDARPGRCGELLLRVYDECCEPAPPGPFLQAAAYNNVLREVDRCVVELIFAHWDEIAGGAGGWDALSFNLSGPSFADEALIAELVGRLDDRPHLRGHLTIEVTETVANRDYTRAVATLGKLREAGYRLALDDIGVGSSNLANLARFPVDSFKIDGQFVTAMLASHYARSVVCFIRDTARRLGMHTVAEFVENEETLGALRVLGIDYAQGFHTGRPAECIPPGCLRDPVCIARPLPAAAG